MHKKRKKHKIYFSYCVINVYVWVISYIIFYKQALLMTLIFYIKSVNFMVKGKCASKSTVQRLNVQLKGESADRFIRIKEYIGQDNDTEAIRHLVSWYYHVYEKDLTGPPKSMWYANLESTGVLIYDPSIGLIIHISFLKNVAYCDHDKSENCRHIQFALSQKDVAKIINEQKKTATA